LQACGLRYKRKKEKDNKKKEQPDLFIPATVKRVSKRLAVLATNPQHNNTNNHNNSNNNSLNILDDDEYSFSYLPSSKEDGNLRKSEREKKKSEEKAEQTATATATITTITTLQNKERNVFKEKEGKRMETKGTGQGKEKEEIPKKPEKDEKEERKSEQGRKKGMPIEFLLNDS